MEQNKARVFEVYHRDGEFEYLEAFQDRTIDVTQPLAAIVEVVWKDATDLGQERIKLIKATSITRREKGNLLEDLRILKVLKTHAVASGAVIGTASELAELEGLRGTVNEYQLSAVLRRYGFETKSSRKGKGGVPKHRYTVEHERLEELLTRFAGS